MWIKNFWQTEKYIAHLYLPILWKIQAFFIFFIMSVTSILYFFNIFGINNSEEKIINIFVGIILLLIGLLQLIYQRVFYEIIMSVFNIRRYHEILANQELI